MTGAEATHDRTRATATWMAITGGAFVAIVALHAIGGDPRYSIAWSNLWQWLDGPPDRVLMALARVIALILAYYIAATTVLYTLARASKIPGLIRSVEWATLPAIRRVAERAVAVSLTVSSLTGGSVAPALASSDTGPVPTPAIQRIDEGPVEVPIPFVSGGHQSDEAPPVTTPTAEEAREGGDRVVLPPPIIVTTPTTGSVVPSDVPPRLIDPTAADAIGAVESVSGSKSASQAYEYVVVRGDNMWVAAERHLEEVMGRSPSEAETATYWSHMVEVNRPLIRSGDPDLIFPGEIIVCPAVDEAGL